MLVELSARSVSVSQSLSRAGALVPSTMASVSSGFIDKPLRSSQCRAALKQSDSVEVDVASLSAM